MKKLVCALTLSILTFATFALDSENFVPTGRINSYTKTEYAVTTKFGDFFRSVSAKYVHVFDGSGLEVECSTYNAKDALTDKMTYTYDTSRNRTSQVLTDAAGNTQWKMSFEYLADGKIKALSEYDASGTLVGKTIYKYDALNVTDSYYDGNGALLSRTITTNDSEGRPLIVCEYDADGSLDEKIQYTYLDNGKLSAIEIFNSSGVKTSKLAYRYDASNYVSEVQTYTASGTLIQRDIYKVDAKGNPTKINVYAVAEKFGSTVNELQSITEYAYK